MKELIELKKILDEQNDGPFEYLFKFIIPRNSVLDLKAELPNIQFENKESKNGKYISVTFTIFAKTSQEVIDIYEKVANVPGIISL